MRSYLANIVDFLTSNILPILFHLGVQKYEKRAMVDGLGGQFYSSATIQNVIFADTSHEWPRKRN
jgi:hypothetical protein